MVPSKKNAVVCTMATIISTLGLSLIPAAAHAAPASPSSGSESSSSVQSDIVKRQGDLANVNEQALDAKIELDKQTAATATAQGQYDASQANVEAAKAKVAQMGASAYKTSNAASLHAILTSSSPQDLIDQLGTLNSLSDYNTQTLTTYAVAQQAAAKNKATIDAAQKAAAAAEKEITDKKAVLESELPKLQAKLATLTAAEQAQVDAAVGGHANAADTANAAPAPAPAPAAAAAAVPVAVSSGSGGGAQVVAVAMAQQGDPYVFGAAGPSSFDCSGLTQFAYKSVGITLPHSSGAQRSFGTSVSMSALQPGDLLFASGHVAIYIGGGTVVHAPVPGSVVRTMPMQYMSWDTARRLV